MNTENVQGTNDSSIVSKLSMVNSGYFHDPFIKHFVEKPSRRSPLINRCYFARAAAISHCVERFLKNGNSSKQIISLGAGFDTTYLRMKEKALMNNTYFVEVDFPDVIRRKITLAKRGGLLTEVAEIDNTLDKKLKIIYKTHDYCAIGFDLQLVGREFDALLSSIGVDIEKPSLFLSEVVLTYLPSKKSSKVIKWVSDTFKNAVFTIFEQVSPYDSFGKVMIKHFKQIGSPLLTIDDYPNISDHVNRHKQSGLDVISAVTLNRFYYNCISKDVRERVERLEMFDEFEAWDRACQHYVVFCSTNSVKQDLTNLVRLMFDNKSQEICISDNLYKSSD